MSYVTSQTLSLINCATARNRHIGKQTWLQDSLLIIGNDDVESSLFFALPNDSCLVPYRVSYKYFRLGVPIYVQSHFGFNSDLRRKWVRFVKLLPGNFQPSIASQISFVTCTLLSVKRECFCLFTDGRFLGSFVYCKIAWMT